MRTKFSGKCGGDDRASHGRVPWAHSRRAQVRVRICACASAILTLCALWWQFSLALMPLRKPQHRRLRLLGKKRLKQVSKRPKQVHDGDPMTEGLFFHSLVRVTYMYVHIRMFYGLTSTCTYMIGK